MNALNIISGLGSAPSSPSRSRTSSLANVNNQPQQNAGSDASVALSEKHGGEASDENSPSLSESDDEKSPLMKPESAKVESHTPPPRTWRMVPKRFADAIFTSVKVVVTTILAPVTYVVACFFDSEGNFSAVLPIRRLYQLNPRKRRRKSHPSPNLSSPPSDEDHSSKPRQRPKRQSSTTYAAAPAAETSDGFKSESSDGEPVALDDSPSRNTRSKTAAVAEEEAPRRSTRIKIETGSKRGHRSNKSIDGTGNDDDRLTAVANALKSPSSPATKLKYPRAPAPPRPLVPRRQPSYANLYNPDAPKKTLILDLDETLIHSMAKGGRMSTGHMVEVKFQGPVAGGGMVLGPQVPILYYVHERPHCHEFLRKVSDLRN